MLILLKPTKESGNNTSNKKADTLKLEIKTQPGDANSEKVTLTVEILKDGSPEELLKFKTKLEKFHRTEPVNRTCPVWDD